MTSDVERVHAEASVLMKRGMALMTDPREDAAAEALACFDEALAMRRALPVDDDPKLPYGLAACWLNRAEALMRIGGGPALADALTAFDEAIRLLAPLPADTDPLFARRLSVAHLNRGLVLHATGQADEAIDAFTAAITILQGQGSAAIPDYPLLFGATLLNLANAHATNMPASLALVRRTTLRAIELVAEIEHDDANAAEVGLKARYLLCHTYGHDIERQQADGRVAFEDIHRATDAVDDGLALVQAWERRGGGRFRETAAGLFRFGALVYGTYQPQFLDEFVDGALDPAASSPDCVDSPEMRAAAGEIRRMRGLPEA
jgi:tetratricopeptide (TPR) repeat protein